MSELFESNPPATKDGASEMSFEEALTELERIVHDLEDGQIGLDESLARYEQGVALLRQCYGRLRDAEQRILKLTGESDEGEPILQPFQHPTENAIRKENGPRLRRGRDED